MNESGIAPAIPDTSIVRTWNSQWILAKYSFKGKRHIEIERIANFMSNSPGATHVQMSYYFTLPTGVEINDFRVVGDTAVFCGSMNDTGAYGWFNLTTGIDTIYFNIFINPQLLTLTRLTAYADGGRNHMVAVGRMRGVERSCIVEVLDVVNNGNVAVMGQGNGQYTSVGERFDDVFLAGNRVVVAEYDNRDASRAVGLRSAVKNNVLDYNEIYNHNRFIVPAECVGGVLRGTGMTNDTFALAYQHHTATPLSYAMRLHKLYFAGGGPAAHIQSVWGFYTQTVSPLVELSYMSATCRLLALWNEGGAQARLGAFKMTVPGGYNAPFLYYMGNRQFCSLDAIDPTAFVLWGAMRFHLQKMAALDAGIQCNTRDQKAVFPIETGEPVNLSDPLQIDITFSIHRMHKYLVNSLSVNEKCLLSY